MHVKTSSFLFCMRNVPALNYPEQRAHGSRNQPAQLKAVCLQMYFIKDCCYIKKKTLTRITYCITIKKCCFVSSPSLVFLLGTNIHVTEVSGYSLRSKL